MGLGLPACLAGGPGASSGAPDGILGAAAPTAATPENADGASDGTPNPLPSGEPAPTDVAAAPALPSGISGPAAESTPPPNAEGEGDVHLDAKLTRKNLGVGGQKIVLSGRVRCEDAEGDLYGCLAGRFLRIYDASHSSYVDTKIGYADGEPGFFDLTIVIPAIQPVSQPIWSTDPQRWTFQVSPGLHQPEAEDTVLKLKEPPVFPWTVLVVDALQVAPTLIPIHALP